MHLGFKRQLPIPCRQFEIFGAAIVIFGIHAHYRLVVINMYAVSDTTYLPI